MPGSRSLSAVQARRITLAAQGFTSTPQPRKRRPFDPALDRMGVLQIDSVNVFARSHYLPVFSRLGDYDPAALDRLLWSSGEFTEYWAHAATFLRVGDRPLFAFRMDDFHARYAERIAELGPVIDHVRRRLADDGPSSIRELETEPRERRGSWWDWSETKLAVELLFLIGEVVSAGRERFERRYALATDVLPDDALARVPRDEAHRVLAERAARSLGVAALPDLADYFRLKSTETRAAVRDLVDEGVLVPVTVQGWSSGTGAALPAWLHRDAVVPQRLTPDALLTPFDPVVWFRPRAERLFGFEYQIEIYTPKEKRRYGYYCLPLMVDGDLAGRIDLKADRAARTLLVQAAWAEDDAPAHTSETAQSLLAEAARWQGLDRVAWTGVGNLPLPAAVDV